MTATTKAPPDLNTAADALIQAIEQVIDLHGLRDGLKRTQQFYELMGATCEPPNSEEWAELLAVWRGLDLIAAAVQFKQEGSA